jgi:acyl carrier protein
LGVEAASISVESSFFELGGNSLKAVVLARLLTQTHGYQVSPTTLMQCPSVAAVVAEAAASRGEVGLCWFIRRDPTADSSSTTRLLVHLPDISGTVLAYRKLSLGRDLGVPSVGVECTEADLDGCTGAQELSLRFLARLERALHDVTTLYLMAFSAGCAVGLYLADALQGRMEVQMVMVDGALPVPLALSELPQNDGSMPLADDPDHTDPRLERVFSQPSVRNAPTFTGPLLYIESSGSREEFERAGCTSDAIVAAQQYSQAQVHTISGTHQGMILHEPVELAHQVCAFFTTHTVAASLLSTIR